MAAVRARRNRIAPLLAVAVLASILIGVAVGSADADTLAPSTEVGGTGEGDARSVSAGEILSEFTLKASDLGSYSSEAPAIKSPAAVVINAATGKVLYDRKAATRRPMASTTKIMTAVLVLENLRLDDTITVSQKAGQTYEPKPLLAPGDELTVEQLMYALLIRSSNGAAVALAEAVAGDVESFADLMNAKAEALGMDDTHFVNPNGLDADGHYSTAADMAKVAMYAMRDPRFRKIVDTPVYDLHLPRLSKPIEMVNTNKLLSQVDWVTGVKTGLTPKAEQCLVASASRDGVSVISVVLGQPSSDVCWSESRALLEYGLTQFRHVVVMDQGTPVAESQIPYELDGVVRLVTADTVEMDLYRDDEVVTEVRLDRPVALPVAAGERFGEVVVSVSGERVSAVDVVADASFEQTSLGSKLSYYWGRLTRWLGG